MVGYDEVLKSFLYEDGEKKDIINDLADSLNIMVCLNLGLDCLSSISSIQILI